MEKTIEDPLMCFVKKCNVAYTDKEEQDEFTSEMLEDLAKITVSKDQRIAELEREIASLRSRLEDCKRRDITGHSI